MNIKRQHLIAFIISTTILVFASGHALGLDAKTTRNLSSINLEITTHLGDQQNFVDQDLISFFISLDQDAYLYLFYQDAKGDIYQLIPGIAQVDNFYKSGIYIPFPSEKSSFQFYVQEPYGKEIIWVYASDQGNIKFKAYNTNNTIKQIKLNLSEIENKIAASSRKLYDRSNTVIHTKKQH